MIPNKEVTLQFKIDATYVIAGGLGGIGRSIVSWMVDRGATNLILLSRSGTRKSAAKYFVGNLRSRGANIIAPSCDITDEKALAAVIQECQKTMPKICGCVHAGMVVEVSSIASHPLIFRGADCP